MTAMTGGKCSRSLPSCAITPADRQNARKFAIFPWFAEVRDWITLAAHIVFGVTAAATYKALERR